MEADGPDISKYGVVAPNGAGVGIAGLLKNLMRMHPLPGFGRTLRPTPDIFDTLRVSRRIRREIQLADAINIHAQRGLLNRSFERKRFYQGRWMRHAGISL